MEKTHYEKIIDLFFKRRGIQDWMQAREFQNAGAGDCFVGYEAGTKIAILDRKCPAMFEKRRSDDNKYVERRFRFEAANEIVRTAPFGLGVFITRLCDRHGIRIETPQPWKCPRCESRNPSGFRECMNCYQAKPAEVPPTPQATLFNA